MSYRKIAHVGVSKSKSSTWPETDRYMQPSGNVGAPIHKALVDSGRFDITIISRNESTFTSSEPSGEPLL